MRSNRFYFSLILNCLLILASAFLFFFFLMYRQQYSTATGVGILGFLLTLRLIRYVNRSNRILSSFLVYMHEKDPSLSYTRRYADTNFKGLYESLEKLIVEFKENRIDLEVQSQYLESILGNLSTGIICFDDSGKIQTMNKAAEKLLGTGSIHHLEKLENLHPGLGDRMKQMKSRGELAEQIRLKGKTNHLSIKCVRIKQGANPITIISLNDISREMEAQEISSWKKLIRVINHEIMNSMTPIITLSTAIRKKLTVIKTPEALDDAVQSAGIIEERSSGLVSFIERYKELTGLPSLKPERFQAGELLGKMEQLFRESLRKQSILFSCQSVCSIEVEADRQMMEQVLINLLSNAAEAVKHSEDPKIELACYKENQKHICISVRDNGEGIPADKLEQVFVPFFTTREKGSGIGLSLCKQIVQLHHGQIHIDSIPGSGTQVLISI